jgi:hypothetical protein
MISIVRWRLCRSPFAVPGIGADYETDSEVFLFSRD